MDRSDWNIGGQDIDDLRLLFAEGASAALRSSQARIEAESLFEKIERPTELRCGPIYVPSPTHVGKGRELTDEDRRTTKRIAGVERTIRGLHASSPGALRVLKLVYVLPGETGLEIFDVEPGDHGAKLSNLVAPKPEPRLSSLRNCFEASASSHPIGEWLVRLCSRVSKARAAGRAPNEVDAGAVRQISEESIVVFAAASRAWRAACGGRHG